MWSYDFTLEATDNGGPFRILNVIDEYIGEYLPKDTGTVRDDVADHHFRFFITSDRIRATGFNEGFES